MSKISKGWILSKKNRRDADPRNASLGWVYTSIGVCWLLDLLQWTQQPFVPNFLILCLMFWAIYQPERIFYVLVFFLGILVDAGTGAIFGQNALIFCLVVFFTELMSVRLQWLGSVSQALSLIPVFLVPAIVLTLESVFLGTFTFKWGWYYKAAVSAAVWPIWSWFLARRFLTKRE